MVAGLGRKGGEVSKRRFLYKPCNVCGEKEVCREASELLEAQRVWAAAALRGRPHDWAVDHHPTDGSQPWTTIGTAYICGGCDRTMQEAAEDAKGGEVPGFSGVRWETEAIIPPTPNDELKGWKLKKVLGPVVDLR